MTEKTGTDVLRDKLVASNKKLNLAGFASEVGLAPHQIDGFIAGRSVPPAAALCAMAKWFWPSAKFDPERNLLIAGTSESKPLGLIPGPFVPSPRDLDLVAMAREPKTLISEKPEQPRAKGRAGWIGGWL
jgi:hypothetical protein